MYVANGKNSIGMSIMEFAVDLRCSPLDGKQEQTMLFDAMPSVARVMPAIGLIGIISIRMHRASISFALTAAAHLMT